ncbi:hypothetical protein F4677DRAFT_402205 [Hypoxylon crocopeplum]|nr:hypothetical protein F4677DRAFT_402205 [Hypoxylon crocopeplum]
MDIKAEAMAHEIDPLGLLGRPCLYTDGHVLLKPDTEFNTPDFNLLETFQPMQWETSAPEILAPNAEAPSRLGRLPTSVGDINDAYGELDRHSVSIYDSSMAQPLEWQQATPPLSPPTVSDPPAKRRKHSIRGSEGDTKTEFVHRVERKHGQSTHSSSLSSPPDGDSRVDGYRREDHLSKNRVAASKCREKKKRESANLQAREKVLAAERDALKSIVDALRMEVLELKNEVLSHGMCDSSVIQRYINETARQIT